jgi:hypothetical protein
VQPVQRASRFAQPLAWMGNFAESVLAPQTIMHMGSPAGTVRRATMHRALLLRA